MSRPIYKQAFQKKFVPYKNGYVGMAVEQSVHYCPKAGNIPNCLAMVFLTQTGSNVGTFQLPTANPAEPFLFGTI